MTTLLQYHQQQDIKPISNNNEHKYLQIAFEVENNELRKLLGAAFLLDIQKNPTNYTDLLSGAEFVCNGNTMVHRGLNFVLAYLNYGKYIGESFVNDTFTGFVQKNRTESENVSEGTIKRLMNENRTIALDEFSIIKDYLNENSYTYTLWNCSTQKKLFTPRITTLRKTFY